MTKPKPGRTQKTFDVNPNLLPRWNAWVESCTTIDKYAGQLAMFLATEIKPEDFPAAWARYQAFLNGKQPPPGKRSSG